MPHSPPEGEPPARDPEPRADTEAERTRARPRVAVVDDYADIRLFVEMALADAYTVAAYPDGGTALAGLAAAPPDLVLLDLDMPDMDGLEVLRQVRADPRLEAVRVVAFTASARAHDARWVAEAGFDGVVSKPVDDLGAFLGAVAHWTRHERGD